MCITIFAPKLNKREIELHKISEQILLLFFFLKLRFGNMMTIIKD